MIRPLSSVAAGVSPATLGFHQNRVAAFPGLVRKLTVSRRKVRALRTALVTCHSPQYPAAYCGGAGWLRGPTKNGRPLEPDAGNADAGRPAVQLRARLFFMESNLETRKRF